MTNNYTQINDYITHPMIHKLLVVWEMRYELPMRTTCGKWMCYWVSLFLIAPIQSELGWQNMASA